MDGAHHAYLGHHLRYDRMGLLGPRLLHRPFLTRPRRSRTVSRGHSLSHLLVSCASPRSRCRAVYGRATRFRSHRRAAVWMDIAIRKLQIVWDGELAMAFSHRSGAITHHGHHDALLSRRLFS